MYINIVLLRESPHERYYETNVAAKTNNLGARKIRRKARHRKC